MVSSGDNEGARPWCPRPMTGRAADGCISNHPAAPAPRRLSVTSSDPGPHEGAVCLTFDFDTMAAWSGSFGASTPGILSRGEFGGRVGIYRILDTLDRYDIKATFFTPGYTAD